MLKNLAKLVSGLIVSLALATAVYAAVSIRLEDPKSPTNQNTFDINFVTLDTAGNPITVKCFKKGPSDGGFSQFGSDINLAAGGNTGNCSVTGSILNADGTYQFQVTAQAGADSATSSTVSVEYKTGGPDTPTNYSKEQVSSCVWRIKFRTANDGGKTVKVELYRSDNTSFNADSGTRVGSLSIGSNTEGEINNTVGDCNKTWYFAIRAFDSAGNGSGVVGDSVVKVTTTTPTETVTTGAIPVTGVAGAGGQILGEKEKAEGEVEGEATASPESVQVASPSPTGGEVGPSIFNPRNVIIAIVVFGGLILIYLWRRREK